MVSLSILMSLNHLLPLDLILSSSQNLINNPGSADYFNFLVGDSMNLCCPASHFYTNANKSQPKVKEETMKQGRRKKHI